MTIIIIYETIILLNESERIMKRKRIELKMLNDQCNQLSHDLLRTFDVEKSYNELNLYIRDFLFDFEFYVITDCLNYNPNNLLLLTNIFRCAVHQYECHNDAMLSDRFDVFHADDVDRQYYNTLSLLELICRFENIEI